MRWPSRIYRTRVITLRFNLRRWRLIGAVVGRSNNPRRNQYEYYLCASGRETFKNISKRLTGNWGSISFFLCFFSSKLFLQLKPLKGCWQLCAGRSAVKPFGRLRNYICYWSLPLISYQAHVALLCLPTALACMGDNVRQNWTSRPTLVHSRNSLFIWKSMEFVYNIMEYCRLKDRL